MIINGLDWRATFCHNHRRRTTTKATILQTGNISLRSDYYAVDVWIECVLPIDIMCLCSFHNNDMFCDRYNYGNAQLYCIVSGVECDDNDHPTHKQVDLSKRNPMCEANIFDISHWNSSQCSVLNSIAYIKFNLNPSYEIQNSIQLACCMNRNAMLIYGDIMTYSFIPFSIDLDTINLLAWLMDSIHVFGIK